MHSNGQSDIDRVRDATDLVALIGEHITLKPRGREHIGLCPFHDDHSPSFAVVTHKGNAFYKCHSCGAGGDAFDFVQNYHKMDFASALRFLAERGGVTLQPRRDRAGVRGKGDNDDNGDALNRANAFAAEYFRRTLLSPDCGEPARALLEARNISAETAEAFQIGFAAPGWDNLVQVIRQRQLPESAFLNAGLLKRRTSGEGTYDAFRNRLVFPICSELGRPIAFGGRKIDPRDEPKYLNSAESAVFQKSRTLYGLHLAKRSIIDSRQVIVTEGYTDVIACHQAGITNVVGTLGTALTRDHARLLSRLCDTVVVVFDGDEAGQKAADRAVEVFFAETVDIKICILPDGKDPDDLLREEDGAARFRNAVEGAIDALSFKVSRLQQALRGVDGLSARQKLLEQFIRELSSLGFASMQGVRKRLVLTQLADALELPVHDLERWLPRNRPESASPSRPPVAAGADQTAPDEPMISPVPPARLRAERELLAILLYEPGLRGQMIEGDHGVVPVTDLVRPGDFADRDCRALAEVILGWLIEQRDFAVQDLLTTLAEPRQKNLISALYFEGRARCGESFDDAAEALRTAVAAWREFHAREAYLREVESYRRAAPEHPRVEAARDLVERRRTVPNIVSAIPRGIRS